MQDFPANSAKARRQSEGPAPKLDQPEKTERVISGEAKRRKRGLGRQFRDTFIEGNSRMVAEYVTTDIIVPAIRDLIYETLQGALDRWIYGESRVKRGRSSSMSMYSANPPRVDYGKYSSSQPNASMLSRQARARHDFGGIVLQSRDDANDVLDRMFDVLSRYGSVTVATLYELTGIQTSHTDEKWGWTSLAGARAAKQRDGTFLLDIPAPEPLGR